MKKNLASMIIAELPVHLQVRESDDGQYLCIAAQCGLTQVDSSLSLHPSLEHTADSFDRDLTERARLTAIEAAALERARLLREKLFQS